MKKDIRTYGMARSGLHAITSWIMAHYEDVDHEIFKTMTTRDINIPFQCPVIETENIYFLNDIRLYTQSFTDEQLKKMKEKEIVMLGFENSIFKKNKPTIKNKFSFSRECQKYDILIMRDLFNFVASRIKKACLLKMSEITDIQKERTLEVIRVWKIHAKEYLGLTNYLGKDKVLVNFSKWHEDVEYRKEISKNLGMTFTDRGRNIVTAYGGGSSFGGLNFQGQANDMPVNNRWEKYKDGEFYKWLLQDEEAVSLSHRIFQTDEEKKKLHNNNYNWYQWYLKQNYPELFADILNNVPEIPGALSPFDVRILAYLPLYHDQKGDILEIGSLCGKSSCILGKVADILNCKVFCLDKWDKDVYWTRFLTKVEEEYPIDYFKAHIKTENHILMQGDSSERMREIADDSISFLFVDGDHTYEGVKKDCKGIKRVLKIGGVVLFHDYNEKSYPGCIDAVNEYLNENKNDFDIILEEENRLAIKRK